MINLESETQGTAANEALEARRTAEQSRLDGLKTAAERNKWGQFATPFELASTLARYARNEVRETKLRFLDPAIGSGSFFSALSQTFPAETIEAATGIELDPLFARTAETLWAKSCLRVIPGDFTKLSPPAQRFNLVLTNPPYVRHHHLDAAEKERLRRQLGQSLNMEISGLAGLYCYFLLLCHHWMEDQGLAIWLIPSEFMDVNYGVTLRQYLTERVTLLHIHRFCPTDVQFTDALVSSAVVVFRKSAPPAEHHVRFSFAGPIDRPQSEMLVPLELLRRSGKWTRFPTQTHEVNPCEVTLGDVFSIKRGLATGSNSFFILRAEQTRDWQIPNQFLRPILPGPRHVETDIIDAYPDGDPIVSPRLYLLDCNEEEEKIEARWPRFYEYLLKGREKEVAASYLASRRVPWYSQEKRLPAPFLCTYMGRSRNGTPPFRFIWNRSQATAHNVYLMLYPKEPMRIAMKNTPALEEEVFRALQRIAPTEFVAEGRVYGGGLHKVEPGELSKIPAPSTLHVMRTERQERLFT